MINVMLDLETMGVGPDAAVVAIGAVTFDVRAGLLGDTFYRTVDLRSAVAAGGCMDASTVLWWLQCDADARRMIASAGDEMGSALERFTRWLENMGAREELRLWGNGAAFDNVILRQAYERCKMPAPWLPWGDRCYRTLKALRPDVRLRRLGVHHCALDDARSQAEHALRLLAAMQLTPA